jgi:hypothetical protein
MIATCMMITTWPKKTNKIQRMEREVKQTVTLNPKITMMTMKLILMKAMKAVKATKMKIEPKTTPYILLKYFKSKYDHKIMK